MMAFRLMAALPLAFLMFASRDRLPYWEFAVIAIAAMFVVNLWLRFAKASERRSAARIALIDSVLDTALLLAVSF